jgi:hypothetical protein
LASDDADVFRALSRAFAELGIRWYLFGAQAAILHGAVRFTEDVDVTVDLEAWTTRALVDVLERQEFEPRFTDEDFIERTRVIPLVHRPTKTPVDVVLAGPGIEELFFAGAVMEDVDGVSIPVARAEDLVVMKILAGRPKDAEDVAAILAARRDAFDRGRTVELLTMLEAALDQRDLLPAFERAWTRARTSR